MLFRSKWVAIFAARSSALTDQLQGSTFRAPAEIFENEKTLDLGGVRVKMLRLGPGHTRGDTAVFVEGENILFSGDLAMNKLFPAFATPQSRLSSWLTSLDTLDKLRPAQVIGAHYDKGDAAMISAYRTFLTALRDRVAELKKQGKSPDETAITLREIDGLSYEEIASAMNCPVGTVRSRIFRARDAIAARLKPLIDSGHNKRW